VGADVAPVAIFHKLPQESFGAVNIASFVPRFGDREPTRVGGARRGDPFVSFGQLLGLN
jgi:hypothetical protein